MISDTVCINPGSRADALASQNYDYERALPAGPPERSLQAEVLLFRSENSLGGDAGGGKHR